MVNYMKKNRFELSTSKEKKTTPVNEEEKKYDPYEIDKLSKIKPKYKIGFLKFWAAGAVCFFIAIPLGPYLADVLDLIVALGLVLGIVIEYIVNNVIRWMNNENQPTLSFCLYEKKNLSSLFINIAYGLAMVFLIYFTYAGLGSLIEIFKLDLFSDFDFGVEPVLFGLLFLLYDGIVIYIKNRIKNGLKKGKKDEI